MNAKPYPEYKPSSVEWVGSVPKHWSPSRLRDCTRVINGFPFDSDMFHPSDGFPLVRIRDIQGGGTAVKWSGDYLKCAEINNGDILIGMDGDFNAAWWSSGPALLNQRVCCLRSRHGAVVQRFLFYWVPFPLKTLNDITYSTTVKHLSSLDLQKFSIALPPVSEQQAIADFLDDRTAKLDALLDKKRDLIGKLKEKRSSLISRTVTRGLPSEAAAQAGLNPNPKLKPSGITWLGDIPEHWEVKKLSWLFSYGKGREAATLTKEYVGSNPGEYPVYSGQTANEGLMGEIDTYEFDFKVPVILVTTVGAKAMTTRLVTGTLSLSQNCALIIPRSKELVAYFYEAVLQRLFDYEKGSISLIMQPSLRFEDLDRFHVPLMSSQEQLAIASYLEAQTMKIDRMIDKVESAINKLTEYRTALITAAVTGKIDVRNVA